MAIGPFSPDYKVRDHIDTELPPDIAALTTRVDDAEADIDDLETHQAAVEAELAIVAGPQTLAQTFLTAAVLRKVLTVAAGPNNSTVNTAHGITTPTNILSCKVILTNGTNHLCFDQGGLFSATAAAGIAVAIDGTNVGLTSGASGNFAGYAGYIVLEYVD